MKEVAAVLNLTVRTVAFHWGMMVMLNIASSAGLCACGGAAHRLSHVLACRVRIVSVSWQFEQSTH
jgi:hypothetical protein